MKINALALFAAGAVGTTLAAQEQPLPAAAELRTETRTESLAYGAKLWVKNRNGAILVTGWDREELALSAEIRDSDQRRVELVVQRAGGDLEVETRFQQCMLPLPSALAASPRCRMTLSVPRRLLGEFRTTNGPISVTTVQGYVRCETTNGDISLADLAGEAMAETTNGNVEARRLHARIKGGTANGRIDLEDVEGRVQMETTNGRITARNLDGWGEGILLECTNGAIDLELDHATGEILAANTSGAIRVAVANGQFLEQARHRVQVKVPGRDQQIVLETTNGPIYVH
jgi:hypothetical protein